MDVICKILEACKYIHKPFYEEKLQETRDAIQTNANYYKIFIIIIATLRKISKLQFYEKVQRPKHSVKKISG